MAGWVSHSSCSEAKPKDANLGAARYNCSLVACTPIDRRLLDRDQSFSVAPASMRAIPLGSDYMVFCREAVPNRRTSKVVGTQFLLCQYDTRRLDGIGARAGAHHHDLLLDLLSM